FGFSPRACCGQWRGCCMLRDDHLEHPIPFISSAPSSKSAIMVLGVCTYFKHVCSLTGGDFKLGAVRLSVRV
uniref:Uncharacterized protein n=1 Tax=Aegilops tauschii subsp. strangulata TaxID=200361 RepID=A0A453CV50_AEGTS